MNVKNVRYMFAFSYFNGDITNWRLMKGTKDLGNMFVSNKGINKDVKSFEQYLNYMKAKKERKKLGSFGKFLDL